MTARQAGPTESMYLYNCCCEASDRHNQQRPSVDGSASGSLVMVAEAPRERFGPCRVSLVCSRNSLLNYVPAVYKLNLPSSLLQPRSICEKARTNGVEVARMLAR